MSLHTHFIRASILATKRLIALLLLLCAAASFIRSAVADSDILYVGDAENNLVLRFNANTVAPIPGGSPSGVYVLPGSNDLDGPRGIFRLGDRLFVASQNQSKNGVPGQILRYKLFDGRPDGAFVPSTSRNPLYARWHHLLARRGLRRRYQPSPMTPLENLPPRPAPRLRCEDRQAPPSV